MNMINDVSVALVHDYLTQFGGAEQVLASLQRQFPAAPVFTSLHDPAALLPGVDRARVIESFLGRATWLRSHHRAALPLFPLAMRSFDARLRSFDTIVADSSAWAHHAPSSPDQAVVVYCHSPARFIYGDSDYLAATGVSGWKQHGWDALWAGYRWLDRHAFRKADVILANSQLVAERIHTRIGVNAAVLHPPVDVDRFRPERETQPEDWFLVVSRLVPHKSLDLVVSACTRRNIRLKVIGTGRDEARLMSLAGECVEFLGFQTHEQVIDHLRRCRALVLPGVEDFGITSVEAQAAGRPVVAFNRGGARETVIDGQTGVLFGEQTEASLLAAFERLTALHIRSMDCVQHAMTFDESVFHAGIHDAVEDARRIRDRR